MSDKAKTEGAAFDPAANGWERYPTVGFNEWVGPLWRHDDGKRLRFGVVIAPKHLNRIDIVHGGMLATFADQAMGMTGRRATGEPMQPKRPAMPKARYIIAGEAVMSE